MKIFINIEDIPENINPADLARFYSPFLKKSLKRPLSTKGESIKQYIVAQIDQENRVVGYHGLFSIKPDKVAKIILKRMRRIPFKGKEVIIRKFTNRCLLNDRRSHQLQKVVPINQRRHLERRRHTLKILTGSRITFPEQVQFTRKQG